MVNVTMVNVTEQVCWHLLHVAVSAVAEVLAVALSLFCFHLQRFHTVPKAGCLCRWLCLRLESSAQTGSVLVQNQ